MHLLILYFYTIPRSQDTWYSLLFANDTWYSLLFTLMLALCIIEDSVLQISHLFLLSTCFELVVSTNTKSCSKSTQTGTSLLIIPSGAPWEMSKSKLCFEFECSVVYSDWPQHCNIANFAAYVSSHWRTCSCCVLYKYSCTAIFPSSLTDIHGTDQLEWGYSKSAISVRGYVLRICSCNLVITRDCYLSIYA